MQETEHAFVIKQESFEGPIEVLLELIEKRKLFVNDVSLATVTDDFILYIQSKGMLPDMVASFLSVAATLILIKARSLLPNIELDASEAESITDLERRVALYQIIHDVSNMLMKAYGKHIAYDGASRMNGMVFAPDPTLTLDSLPLLIQDMIGRIPPPVPKKQEARVYKTISIGEVLTTLEARIEKAISASFNAIRVLSPDTDERNQKVYTIVSFLGMLELVRRGLIAAEQTELFEDITLRKQEVQNETPEHKEVYA
jgi:segregation and condensation protein A